MALALCDTKTNQQGRELTDHGSALFPIACYHDNLTTESVPWHWHDELELVVVSEGRAVIAAGTQKYTLQQGTGLFINTGVLHAAWSGAGAACRFHSVVFHPRLVGGSIDSIYWQNFIHPILTNPMLKSLCFDGSQPWHHSMIEAAESAWQSCVTEEFGYEFQVRSALSQVMLQLSSCRSHEMKRPSEKALRDNERIKIMLQFMQEHYFEPISAAKIAEQAMISESECLRCFRSIIGTPPIRYLKQLRIQKAADLLVSGHDKIADIGAQCGFLDSSYFVKSFREEKGAAPSEYRKQKAMTLK